MTGFVLDCRVEPIPKPECRSDGHNCNLQLRVIPVEDDTVVLLNRISNAPLRGPWHRLQYRLSDDAAFSMGAPYVVVYHSTKDKLSTWIHFFKWQFKGDYAICLGDEAGHDVPFRSLLQLHFIENWFRMFQGTWCEHFHPEESEDAEEKICIQPDMTLEQIIGDLNKPKA